MRVPNEKSVILILKNKQKLTNHTFIFILLSKCILISFQNFSMLSKYHVAISKFTIGENLHEE